MNNDPIHDGEVKKATEILTELGDPNAAADAEALVNAGGEELRQDFIDSEKAA